MPEEKNEGQEPQDVPQDGAEKKTNNGGESDIETRLAALEAEIAKRDDIIRELRDESASRRIALKKQQEEHLAEQGQWKKLAEQRAAELEALSVYKEQAEALSAMIQKSNEARIQQVPEDMRGVIPDDYSPEKLAAWLDRSLPMLVKPSAPALDAGAGGSGPSTVELTDEQRLMAKRMGISEEKLKEQIKKERGET